MSNLYSTTNFHRISCPWSDPNAECGPDTCICMMERMNSSKIKKESKNLEKKLSKIFESSSTNSSSFSIDVTSSSKLNSVLSDISNKLDKLTDIYNVLSSSHQNSLQIVPENVEFYAVVSGLGKNIDHARCLISYDFDSPGFDLIIFDMGTYRLLTSPTIVYVGGMLTLQLADEHAGEYIKLVVKSLV